MSALVDSAGPVLTCVNEDFSSDCAYHGTSQENVVKIGAAPSLPKEEDMLTKTIKMITSTFDDKLADLHESQHGVLDQLLYLTRDPENVGNLGRQSVKVQFDKEDLELLKTFDEEDIKELIGEQIPSRWLESNWSADEETGRMDDPAGVLSKHDEPCIKLESVKSTTYVGCCPHSACPEVPATAAYVHGNTIVDARSSLPDKTDFFFAKAGLWLGVAGALLGRYAVHGFCIWQGVEERQAAAISKIAAVVGSILAVLTALDCEAVRDGLTVEPVVTHVLAGFLRVACASIGAYYGVFEPSHLLERHEGAICFRYWGSFVRVVLAFGVAAIGGYVAGVASDATVSAGAALARGTTSFGAMLVSKVARALC